eukprot:1820163-Rhodomonas_salina.4
MTGREAEGRLREAEAEGVHAARSREQGAGSRACALHTHTAFKAARAFTLTRPPFASFIQAKTFRQPSSAGGNSSLGVSCPLSGLAFSSKIAKMPGSRATSNTVL